MIPPRSGFAASPPGGRPPTARQSRFRGGCLLGWSLRLLRPCLAPLAVLVMCSAQAEQVRVLDDFRDASRWQAQASDQVSARVERDSPGRGTCLHYDFGRVSGYAVMRRALPLQLPAHYAFSLRLHGQAHASAFQLKLVDASGDNVWWMNRPDFEPPARSRTLRIRQRQIEFAWGPTQDKVLRQAAAIELVVASGRAGGSGRLCFERLALHDLPAPPTAPVPKLTLGAFGALLDLGVPQELNGVVWRWAATDRPRDAQLQLSDDGHRWRTVHTLHGSRRDGQAVWLPEQEARFVRVASRSRVAELRHAGPTDWPDRNALLRDLAARAPRSHFPRGFHGEQSYWTVVGTDGGGAHAALISEDGAVEPARAGPSIEPLLRTEDGRLLGWADTSSARTSLHGGYLPIPRVDWQFPGLALHVAAAASGTSESAQLLVRYTVTNTGTVRQRPALVLALRPWQVNPPQQFLNTPGGFAAVKQLAWSSRTLQVNARPWLHAIDAPTEVQLAAFDQAEVLAMGKQAARKVTVPSAPKVTDATGLASGRLQWALDLVPGESRSVHLALPLAGNAPVPADSAAVAAAVETVASQWQARLNQVGFTLPPQAQPLHDSLRSALGHILMQRDGPALQPGTRSYARSWIRDGAMMVSGLLRLGEVQASRDFVHWFAGHLFANGKVPCCVDRRGADPVAENDSHGEFIHAVAELWRHTQDRAELSALWPKVDAAARYMEQLRQSERSDANRQPGREANFGTMPASISHEGYSAKPMHSHWDNFWALAGWRDAAVLARLLGQTQRAEELQAQLDEFKRELAASIATTMRAKHIDHLPGAAELGDFDPTSSTMIFSPAGAEELVSRATLDATWQRYWDESQLRRERSNWQDYTPYELRSVSALVRLGQAERGLAMLDFFFADQRPAGWNQWAEVVGRLPREPRFIGDMPHAWISSDFVRSALDLLAFERDSDQALVLAAGVPPDWLNQGPVGVTGLRTAHGRLSYTLRRDGAEVLLQVTPGLAAPHGGMWLAWSGRMHRVPGDGLLRVPWSPLP